MKIIKVHAKNPYNVYIGNNILDSTQMLLFSGRQVTRVTIVTDDIVEKLYLDRLKKSISSDITISTYVVKNGESAKCSENLISLWSFFAEQGLTRSDMVIALGGGVIGDLAGFAASTYLRGIAFAQIPTTLLAQVDSSVGGKTAINITEGKNLAGTFYQPIAVICDIATLNSLSDKIFSDGVAEIIKYGCIHDEELFTEINGIKNADILTRVISRCISIKADVVANDEFDTGSRMLLNFGHTIAHAIERYYNFSKYTHGQAVAIGMVCITELAENMNLTESGTADKIKALCSGFGLPTECEIPNSELLSLCLLDKKNINRSTNLILLENIGSAYIKKFSKSELATFLSTKSNGVHNGH